MQNILFLAISLFLSANLFSQTESSLLWKISKKGIKNNSYLFGTIHSADKRVFEQFGSTFDSIFTSCDAYAMEILPDDKNLNNLAESITMKDGNLNDYLNDRQKIILDSILRERIGLGFEFFKKIKPIFLTPMLEGSYSDDTSSEILDFYLLTKARNVAMKTVGIESISEQIAAVNALKTEDQIKMLTEYLDNISLKKNDNHQYEELIAAYTNANLNKLEELLHDTSIPVKFTKTLVSKRNKNMAKRIANMSKQQSTFCAIGAGHLPGNDGIINLLRKKGFTIEAIKF